MSLDLIQARHERETHLSRKSFALDQRFHAQLLARAQPHEEYPLLHRLRYHADTAFTRGELPLLHAELERITAQFTERTQIRAVSRFVEQAIADGDNLYASAD